VGIASVTAGQAGGGCLQFDGKIATCRNNLGYFGSATI
jgi:hypothetical protein